MTTPGTVGQNPPMARTDLVVLFEHPEWQRPLFAALEASGVRFEAFDLKSAAFDVDQVPEAYAIAVAAR